ncbi:HAMP domain-containing histidine kinase [Pseudacidovorax sp. RU35E]|uniref:HAMP domain-containing histidine kinase n=1 Tax=Pseudacidovorax sp. RU35E TaxID=1907403 RepID=UPI0009546AC7|nr:HAMP domain-containing histidine kinase [Pseudacidovorax sp. RU35E]SIQ73123.1 two-component system, OmpR family, sensor kinase/two-component system, OmpR family, sensor histidine kinase QseC [Pseudacidovorax sp. RU35E]
MTATVTPTPLRPAPPLRRHLFAWLVLLHLTAGLLATWAAYSVYGHVIEDLRDEQMRSMADSYAGRRHVRELPNVGADAIQQRGALVVQLWTPDGQRQEVASAELPVGLQARAGFADLHTGPLATQRWRVYTAPAEGADRLRVQVLQSRAFRQQRSIRRALAEGLPILALLPAALLLQWLVVWRATRSLRAVARDVAAQDERSPRDMPPERVPAEIRPLVQAFNALLGRLRAALQAQQRFVADAAHELRTPFTAIGLQLDNLRPHVPEGAARQNFAALEAGVARAQRLQAQLLRLSHQEAAEPLQPEAVPLVPLLRDAVAQFTEMAEQRRVDLGFLAAPALQSLQLQGAPVELRSLFDNLLDNAVRHSLPGGCVDLVLHALPSGDAVVDVVDEGPGIAEDVLPRVFDRFYRAPGAAAGGSGLGLAIAASVARRHGLRVELLNRRGPERRSGLRARVHLAQAPTHSQLRNGT